MADNRNPMLHGDLRELCQLAVTALLDREIDDNRARLHAFHHRFRHQNRGFTARNKRGADDDILLFDRLGDQVGLLLPIACAHFLGVAACGLRLLELFVDDGDEGCAQAFHLFFRRGTHIGRRHDAAQAARGGNCLKPGHACTHHQHAGGGNGSGGGHHHREAVGENRRGFDHGLIARKIGLGR